MPERIEASTTRCRWVSSQPFKDRSIAAEDGALSRPVGVEFGRVGYLRFGPYERFLEVPDRDVRHSCVNAFLQTPLR